MLRLNLGRFRGCVRGGGGCAEQAILFLLGWVGSLSKRGFV